MEYIIGYSAGIAQTLVGYPLDTIKTRLQCTKTRITTSSTINSKLSSKLTGYPVPTYK